MPMLLLLISLLGNARSENLDYLTSDEVPTSGPSLDTAYVPGTPGAEWTGDEIKNTRNRILQAIHPDWETQYNMFGRGNWGPGGNEATENRIMRLVFHDCIRYTDGTGGCDGCLNWKGVGAAAPAIFNASETYKHDPINETDNNGLQDIVEALELIYTTVDWPLREVSLSGSLQQLGKSRADLWQFAGIVALERALERANRACDLDKWSRQQTALLESREACEFKLRVPLKFKSGREDCIPEDGGTGYKAAKIEVQPLLLGDGNHATDFFLTEFGMEAELSQALQAVHGAVHSSALGVKYTWFGSGYISNMYYKWIANYATFEMPKKGGGGDLSFKDKSMPGLDNVNLHAKGDTDGNPRNQTGWRASCMYSWDTIEGGPCVLRPVTDKATDGPDPYHFTFHCVEGYDQDWKPILQTKRKVCSAAWADENNIIHGAQYDGPWPEEYIIGGYNATDSMTRLEIAARHAVGWNNQFAFPWEVGAYWNLTTSREDGQRSIGCPGLDTPFEDWPFKTADGSPIYGSPAMQCSKNTYLGLSDIVEKFANDNQYWSVKFLEGWDKMATNGYDSLTDGPEEGWLGYYSLDQQGKMEGASLKTMIEENAETGLVWTDPTADPTICGHRGHADTSCGLTFSHVYDSVINGDGNYEGTWSQPPL